jgi:hypothetical protein
VFCVSAHKVVAIEEIEQPPDSAIARILSFRFHNMTDDTAAWSVSLWYSLSCKWSPSSVVQTR